MTSLSEAWLEGFIAGRTLPTEGFDEIFLEKLKDSLFSKVNARTSSMVHYLPREILEKELTILIHYFERKINECPTPGPVTLNLPVVAEWRQCPS